MTLFIITHDDVEEKVTASVGMNRHAFNLLFDLLTPVFNKTMNSHWLVDRDLAFDMDIQSLDEVPDDVFVQVHDIIISATNKHDELKPFAQELKQKLEADPRFEHEPI